MLKIEYKALVWCANKKTLHRYKGRLSMNTVDAVQNDETLRPSPAPTQHSAASWAQCHCTLGHLGY